MLVQRPIKACADGGHSWPSAVAAGSGRPTAAAIAPSGGACNADPQIGELGRWIRRPSAKRRIRAPSIGIRIFMASARSTPVARATFSDLASGPASDGLWAPGVGIAQGLAVVRFGGHHNMQCGGQQRPTRYCGWEMVPHTGFEPVISALRGRCPGPLDECGAVGRRRDRQGRPVWYQRLSNTIKRLGHAAGPA